MKKGILLLTIIILLCGCNNTTNDRDENLLEDEYLGGILKISVVGSSLLPDVGNVQYEYVELGDISKDNKKFDALIVTREAFIEADDVKYVDFYEKVDYPVFFFGMKDFQMFAFTNMNMTIENSKDDNVAYVEGFRNFNGEREGVKLYKNADEDSDKKMLVRIFNYINTNYLQSSA
ncbi:hypothetical protein [Lysinibacillus xylanilyticus]|uniref:hypothetical protein n=1 Tax=Lysinibacillus xylanilyticus TaxID=582475 RepID=UPI003CFFFD9F